jgi:hypothetical protein
MSVSLEVGCCHSSAARGSAVDYVGRWWRPCGSTTSTATASARRRTRPSPRCASTIRFCASPVSTASRRSGSSRATTTSQEIADELIDRVEARRELDLVDDFAFPLPITVIAELLGGRSRRGPPDLAAAVEQRPLLVQNPSASGLPSKRECPTRSRATRSSSSQLCSLAANGRGSCPLE